jgi:3-isopropylmalate dehydratase small subunit
MDENISTDDIKRVRLLDLVSKKGLKELSLEQLKLLQELVEKKDYRHNKKAHKSKMQLLAKINVAIYELEEGRQGI